MEGFNWGLWQDHVYTLQQSLLLLCQKGREKDKSLSSDICLEVHSMSDNQSLVHVNCSGYSRNMDKLETYFRSRMDKNCSCIMQISFCQYFLK